MLCATCEKGQLQTILGLVMMSAVGMCENSPFPCLCLTLSFHISSCSYILGLNVELFKCQLICVRWQRFEYLKNLKTGIQFLLNSDQFLILIIFLPVLHKMFFIESSQPTFKFV